MKRQSTILYILIFIVLAAMVFLVFVAAPGADIETVPVILPPTDPDDGSDEDAESVPQIIEVSPDTVQTVIRTLKRADAYSRTICAENFWSGGQTRRNIDVWVNGDACKMEINRDDGISTMHILIIGGEKTLWYSDRYGSFEGPASSGEADRYQSLLSYERILELPKSSISEAGYVEYMDEMCIYVRYCSGELGYDNICYVSLVSGLVIGEESYEGEELVVRVSSTMANLSEPEESVFAKP